MLSENPLWPSHLNIRVEAGLFHTLPVLSSVKMQSIHPRCKHLCCYESRATSISISNSGETKYDSVWSHMSVNIHWLLIFLIFFLWRKFAIWLLTFFLSSLPSGYQTPCTSQRVLSMETEGHVCTRDPRCSVQHMGGQGTRRAGHRCDLHNQFEIFNWPA